jgi:hypothetical protein
MPRLIRGIRRRRRRPFWHEETFAVVIFLGLLTTPFVICGFADFRLFLAVTGTCFVSLVLTVALVAGATFLAARFEPSNLWPSSRRIPPPPPSRINEQGEILRDHVPAVPEYVKQTGRG